MRTAAICARRTRNRVTQPKNSTAAPIAPRRPHSFTTHGITVADDYAWLKDDELAGGAARSVAARAGHPRLSRGRECLCRSRARRRPRRCRSTLVAEMRGRIKEDDSSVPAPDGPFAYFARFREGGQHELFGRTPRDGGDDADHPRRRCAGARQATTSSSAARGIRPTTRCRRGAPTSTARNISRSASATGPTAPTCADVIEETDGGVVWSADSQRVLLRQARRQPPPDAGLPPSARHAAGRRRAGL